MVWCFFFFWFLWFFNGVGTLLEGGGSLKWGLGFGEEERERERGDSLYTEGIRRRMINYWYSVVTAECSVGQPLFFYFYFTTCFILLLI